MKKNFFIFYIVEISRALIFTVPIWVAFERQFLNLTQFTFVEAIIIGTQLLLELPTGALADLWGKRFTIALGYFCTFIGLLVFASSTTFSLFILYALITGLGEAFISGAKEALLYDSLKQIGKEETFDKVTSKYSLLFQLSLAIATIIGGFMGIISYQLPIYATAMATLIGTIACLFFQEPYVDTEKFTLQRYALQTKLGVKELLKNDHIRQISLFYILVGGISWVCQLVFNTSILTELKHTSQEIGILYASLRILNAVVLFRILHVGKLLTRKRAFLLFPIMMIIALLPGMWMKQWVVLPFLAMIMFVSNARWVVLGKYTNEEFDSKNRATAISTLSMGVGIFYMFTLLIFGPIMDWLGTVKIAYTLLGIISLVTVLPLGLKLAKQH
jgi:MFS family permease